MIVEPALLELASGIDALYLSGRAALPEEFGDALEGARAEALLRNSPVAFELNGDEFNLQPHAWGKYRYCLDHPWAMVGITFSKSLPAFRIQPRAEFLHGVGPREAVEWFRYVFEPICSALRFSVTRVDLFADFQGWALCGNDRYEFLCRAANLNLHEAAEKFHGIQFGKRSSGSIIARLYDKSIESAEKGTLYWPEVWGRAYNPERSVLRVEFEIQRGALREFALDSPEEVLDAAGALWTSLTFEWLRHCTPNDDTNRGRWPTSAKWQAVQRARIAEDSIGIERTYDGTRRGRLWKIMPGFVGYLASVGALTKSEDFADMVPHLSDLLRQYAHDSGRTLEDRITEKRQRYGVG